jgi:prolipoprotein diacylglyceryltransferase
LADRRQHYTKGRAFALYVILYTIGRGWIEALRIDDAHRFFGLRLNDWTSLVVFVAAVVYFVVQRPRHGDGDAPDDDTIETTAGHTLTP